LPWVLVGMSLAAVLFGTWWISGTRAAVAFVGAWWPWLLIGAAGAVILSVFVWWLWWQVPKRQASRLDFADLNEKARADAEDNFRKTIGQVLGGVAVLIGAAFAYLQFTDQQRTSQQQLQASQDLLISNQVGKGFELLGNKDGLIEQRLGRIYTLEGVDNSAPG
jgi:type VI protein secretion system component VasK